MGKYAIVISKDQLLNPLLDDSDSEIAAGGVTDHVGTLGLAPVNLDGMDKSELSVFVAATRGIRPAHAAQRLFPAMPASVLGVVRLLCGYARNKITAMACRERGEIRTAIRHEDLCERIYNDLPEYARW